jgi:hypothetical protein
MTSCGFWEIGQKNENCGVIEFGITTLALLPTMSIFARMAHASSVMGCQKKSAAITA